MRRCNRYDYQEYDIDMQKLKMMVNKGCMLIDVRSKQEFNEGHLEKAILIPNYEIINQIKQMDIDKSETIIVYCGIGTRSKNAQEKLRSIGYKNVFNLYNGLQNYCTF